MPVATVVNSQTQTLDLQQGITWSHQLALKNEPAWLPHCVSPSSPPPTLYLPSASTGHVSQLRHEIAELRAVVHLDHVVRVDLVVELETGTASVIDGLKANELKGV